MSFAKNVNPFFKTYLDMTRYFNNLNFILFILLGLFQIQISYILKIASVNKNWNQNDSNYVPCHCFFDISHEFNLQKCKQKIWRHNNFFWSWYFKCKSICYSYFSLFLSHKDQAPLPEISYFFNICRTMSCIY